MFIILNIYTIAKLLTIKIRLSDGVLVWHIFEYMAALLLNSTGLWKKKYRITILEVM